MSKIKLAGEPELTVEQKYEELMRIHTQQGMNMQRLLDKNMELGEKLQAANLRLTNEMQNQIKKDSIVEKRIADVNQQNNEYLEEIMRQREEIKAMKERLGER